MEAGLPNIEGVFKSTFTVARDKGTDTTGAFQSPYSKSTGYYGGTAGDSSWGYGFKFNASLSNPIYGNSEMVAPLSQSTLYILKY